MEAVWQMGQGSNFMHRYIKLPKVPQKIVPSALSGCTTYFKHGLQFAMHGNYKNINQHHRCKQYLLDLYNVGYSLFVTTLAIKVISLKLFISEINCHTKLAESAVYLSNCGGELRQERIERQISKTNYPMDNFLIKCIVQPVLLRPCLNDEDTPEKTSRTGLLFENAATLISQRNSHREVYLFPSGKSLSERVDRSL